jgi:NAD(P)-dependent dehydrogenase (short-subunit alcohol dehydrogenase family)
VEAARSLGGPDLLVNNASALGPSPQPKLADYPLDVFRQVYEVNVTAPLALIQLALPLLAQSPQGRILNVTSDAGVEGYEGWGGYGSSKAALEQLSKVLAAEQPQLRVWWVDPGDMNTQMHQEAFPGEDISDRPPPEESVPGLLRLIDDDLPSGRYSAREVAAK